MICAKQWSSCVFRSCEQLARVPSEQVMTVRYDSLMDDATTLESLCSFIGVDSAPVIESCRSTLQRGNDNKWRAGLSASQIVEIDEYFNLLPAELVAQTKEPQINSENPILFQGEEN
jgi:hypothetical protein